jgi:glycosyltransferase 2 family protein
MISQPRRVAEYFGIALSCCGLMALIWELHNSELPSDLFSSNGATLRELAFLTLAITVCTVPIGVAWLLLLRLLAYVRQPSWLIGVYFVTQLSKYLPGNVFHYVSRYAVLSRIGISLQTFVAAAVGEAVCLAAVAGLFIVLGSTAGVFVSSLPMWDSVVTGLAVLAGIIVLTIVVFAFYREKLKFAVKRSQVAVFLCFALAADAVFFLGMALAVSRLIVLFAPNAARIDFVELLSAVSAAWLVGFLVPGSPAGLGVREAVLLVLLGSSLGAATAVVVASLRAATILADVVLAGIGTLVLVVMKPTEWVANEAE